MTLTKEQSKSVEILIRLGDSRELAIKTVLGKKTFSDNGIYELHNI